MKPSDMKPGDLVEVFDPYHRISYGQGGRGIYKVVRIGRVNVIASCDVRFSPTGPWHRQEHKIPIAHVVRVVHIEGDWPSPDDDLGADAPGTQRAASNLIDSVERKLP